MRIETGFAARHRAASWVPSAIVQLLVALCVSACTNLSVNAGRRIDVTSLDQALRIGESTREDVKRAMGEPFGQGQSMLPTDSKPKDLWTYYYEESTMKETHRIFLWVFFEGEHYDGYLWFSSLPAQSTADAAQSRKATTQ